MKTTLNIEDQLLVKAKVKAAEERITLTRMVEEGLRLRLQGQPRPAKPGSFPISTKTGGLRPGIDGRSNRSMFDAADAADGWSK